MEGYNVIDPDPSVTQAEATFGDSVICSYKRSSELSSVW